MIHKPCQSDKQYQHARNYSYNVCGRERSACCVLLGYVSCRCGLSGLDSDGGVVVGKRRSGVGGGRNVGVGRGHSWCECKNSNFGVENCWWCALNKDVLYAMFEQKIVEVILV
jgi:hypothetical protein